MTRYIMTVILASIMAITASAETIPYNPDTMHFELSPEQAKAIADTWRNDNRVTYSLKGITRLEDIPNSEFYVFEYGDNDQIEVDCHSAYVRFWSNLAGYKAFRDAQRNGALQGYPDSDLLSTADEFVQAKCPLRKSYDMRRIAYKDHLRAMYQGYTRDGVRINPVFCSIAISPYTNDILSYRATRAVDISISSVPSVTAGAAENTVLQSCINQRNAYSVLITEPTELGIYVDDFGVQSLLWRVCVVMTSDQISITPNLWSSGEHIPGAESADYFVDASTGDVTASMPYLGAQKPSESLKGWTPKVYRISTSRRGKTRSQLSAAQAQPAVYIERRHMTTFFAPLQRKGTTYWYARYLSSEPWKVTLSDHKSYMQLVARNGVTYRLYRKSPDKLNAGNRITKLKRPAIWLSGRMYLPIEAFELLTGDRFETAEDGSLHVERSH